MRCGGWSEGDTGRKKVGRKKGMRDWGVIGEWGRSGEAEKGLCWRCGRFGGARWVVCWRSFGEWWWVVIGRCWWSRSLIC